MKKFISKLQRFHIETIMYLIVIIVALVLLYLFMNNKINFFEEFQSCNIQNTSTKPKYNLILYHNDKCAYSNKFKTNIWDKMFVKVSPDVQNDNGELEPPCSGQVGNNENDKLKCNNPSKVNTYLESTTAAATNVTQQSINTDLYYDRGYYYIHPFFERWFKDIFIIKNENDNKYSIEFIKFTSQGVNGDRESFINRLGVGSDNLIKFEDDKNVGTYESAFFSNTGKTWDTNIIGKNEAEKRLNLLIRQYVEVIIHTKFYIENTPAIILEDTEHKFSEEKYKIRFDGESLTNYIYNYQLTDSIESIPSPKKNINSNYNLIVTGLNETPLEDLFLTNTYKFINDREDIVSEIGCVNSVTIETEYEIYIYYSDNCSKSYACLKAIKDNTDILNNYHKIILIKLRESNCSKSDDVIYCSESKDTCNLIKNYFIDIPNEKINYINFNKNDVTKVINYEVNQQFITTYGHEETHDNNINFPFIILFSKGPESKPLQMFVWTNGVSFINNINAYLN